MVFKFFFKNPSTYLLSSRRNDIFVEYHTGVAMEKSKDSLYSQITLNFVIRILIDLVSVAPLFILGMISEKVKKGMNI